MTHGRYSKIARADLEERIKYFGGDPDPLNLEPEVALLRAITEDLINRWDKVYGPNGALLAWHESFKRGKDEAKPRHVIDFSAISGVVDKIGAMVDRIHRHRSEGFVSLATLNRVVEQLGVEVVLAMQELKLDADTSAALSAAIERRWGAIKLDADSPGHKRAPEGA